MQDRPTAAELLATVATYLEDELMPALDGPLAYRTRVAANLVRNAASAKRRLGTHR